MISKTMGEMLTYLFLLLPAFVATFTFRGFFKALIAKWCGDPTADDDGFVSLNPLEHIDFYGLVVILVAIIALGMLLPGALSRSFVLMLIIIAGVRWTYPVPIEPHRFKNLRLGVISTSLAGAIGSFILVLVCMYLFMYAPVIGRLSIFADVPARLTMPLYEILKHTIQLASWFGVLGLVPLPPFDAGKMLPVILPPSMYHVIAWLEEYALFVFIFLFVMPGISDFFLGTLSKLSMFMIKLLSYLVF